MNRFKEYYYKAVSGLEPEERGRLGEYLKTRGSNYFKAPAATKFHSAYEGGLVVHSCNVVDNLVKLTEKFHIKWERECSPYLIGLFHDLCKVDFYKVSMRNVKNEETGKWEKQPYYEIDDQIPLGHGAKSVMLLQEMVHLTRQEIFCITYHMHAFGDSDYQKDFSRAVNKYPEILMVCMADHLAGITEQGVILPFEV